MAKKKTPTKRLARYCRDELKRREEEEEKKKAIVNTSEAQVLQAFAYGDHRADCRAQLFNATYPCARLCSVSQFHLLQTKNLIIKREKSFLQMWLWLSERRSHLICKEIETI